MKQMLHWLREQQRDALSKHEKWLAVENEKLKERMQFMVRIQSICVGCAVKPYQVSNRVTVW
jgi:hypothetical protein